MNFLTLIPARYRQYAYALLSLLSVGYGAYQVSDGNWEKVIAAVLTALIGATAASNTNAE